MKIKPLSILFVGYATIDFIDNTKYFGGAAGAMSINATLLDIKSNLFAPLSQDILGSTYIQQLNNAKVGLSSCGLSSPSIPTCTVVDHLGLGSTRKWQDNGAISYFQNMPIPYNLNHLYDYIFFCNAPSDVVNNMSQNLTKRNALYIPGPQSLKINNWIQDTALLRSLIVFCNEEEEPVVWKSQPFKKGVELVICTHGKKGGVVHTSNGEKIPYQSKLIQVVDPTGAGDSFALGFAHSYLAKNDIISAIKAGKQLAERCIKVKGSILNYA